MEQSIPSSSENTSDATQTPKKEWVKPEMTEMDVEGGFSPASGENIYFHPASS